MRNRLRRLLPKSLNRLHSRGNRDQIRNEVADTSHIPGPPQASHVGVDGNALFAASPAPIILVTENGILLSKNRAIKKLKLTAFTQGTFSLRELLQIPPGGELNLLHWAENKIRIDAALATETGHINLCWHVLKNTEEQGKSTFFLQASFPNTSQQNTDSDLLSFRTAMEVAGIGICILCTYNNNLTIRWCNSKFRSMLDVKNQDVILNQNHRIIESKYVERDKIQTMRTALFDKEPCTLILKRNKERSIEEWHEATVLPLPKAQNAPQEILLTIRDATIDVLTDRKHIKNEKYLSNIVDSVLEGIITINSQGFITMFSHAASMIFGYSRDEVIGQNISMLMPRTHREAHDSYMGAYRETSKKKIIGKVRELEGRRANGDLFPIELAVSEIRFGDDVHFVGVVRDITDRQRIDRMKNEFVSTVSHELRTPLTSIQGALGILRAGSLSGDPDQVNKLIEIAYGNSMRLMRLINDILDIEKIEAGGMQFRMVDMDLHSLVKDVVAANSGYANKFDVSLSASEITEYYPIIGDYDRLSQVLTNLVSNAINHSKKGDFVEVFVTRGSDEYIRVSVKDHGPGVPKEFHDKIFQRFRQADSSDARRRGGSGLGLSIAKAIVDYHGGRIGFTSKTGEGSTFWFEVPSIIQKREFSHLGTPHFNQSRVLICGGGPDVGDALQATLERHSFQASQVPSTMAALTVFEKGKFNAVILDASLPKEEQFSLLQELKKDSNYGQLPVLLMSTRSLDPTHGGAKKTAPLSPLIGNACAVVDWIPSPVDRARLSKPIEILKAKKKKVIRILVIELDTAICRDLIRQISNACEILFAYSRDHALTTIEESTDRFDLVYLAGDIAGGSYNRVFECLVRCHGKLPSFCIVSRHYGQLQVGEDLWWWLVNSKHVNTTLEKSVENWLYYWVEGVQSANMLPTE